MELGKIRKGNPDGMAFLEYYIVEQARERIKKQKKAKANAKKGRHR